MKKTTFLLIGLFLLNFSSFAQLKNIKPNPKGEPWYLGNLRPLTAKDKEKIAKMPELKLSDAQKKLMLPSVIDNSEKEYFPPIFNQDAGSCGQASGVAYNFTYEMNFTKGTNASASESNQYPSHYTYNFLNEGDPEHGSYYFDGWEIINANGCPTIDIYGGLFGNGVPYWMSGYDKYYSGMNHRTLDVYKINVGTQEGLNTLKQWMFNHLDNSSAGGLANFAAGASEEDGLTMDYNGIISSWGTNVNHAMTFVGYDDTKKFDFNNDGQYTTDVDINNDGVVNLKDCEVGALIMVNSWGTFWGVGGKAYVMYKLLAEMPENGGIQDNTVFCLRTKETYSPKLTIKTKLSHNSRNKIKIIAGVATNTSATEPEHILEFPLFNYQGGEFYMKGGSSVSDKTIEIGLDITPLLSYVQSGQAAKYFLCVTEKDADNSSSGEIIDFSIMDYTQNTPQEIICNSHNVALENNSTTQLSVNVTPTFDAPTITSENLPEAKVGQNYSHQLTATGGEAPYIWNVYNKYTEEENTDNFPQITSIQLTPSSDDDGTVKVPIDFNFPFYGKEYNELLISTDGSIVFDDGFNYIRNESSIKGNKTITVFGADLLINSDDNDGIWIEKNATSITIRWKMSQFKNAQANIEVAAKLHSNGNIEFFYKDAQNLNSEWCAGISKGDKTSHQILSISGKNIASPITKQMQMSEYPLGLEITKDGILQGKLKGEEKAYSVTAIVTDNNKISTQKKLELNLTLASICTLEKIDFKLIASPNQIKNKSRISFSLEERASVEIQLLSTTGQVLKTITKGTYNTGTHRVDFNINLASGLYYIRLKTNEQQQTVKIIKL